MISRYGIKDIFDTLQGEGARAGSRSVFVRFTGCNLWSGDPLQRDRGAGPCAKWCDTDFRKGRVLSLDELLEEMDAAWASNGHTRWCVLTGGEPGLQINDALVEGLHERGWLIAVETNGTVDNMAIRHCDHVCLSPKQGTDWHNLGFAHEVKVVLPGAMLGEPGWTDAELLAVEETTSAAMHSVDLFVQPQDPIIASNVVEFTLLKGGGAEVAPEHEAFLHMAYEAHVARCIAFVKAHPQWRLSLQLHKTVNIP